LARPASPDNGVMPKHSIRNRGGPLSARLAPGRWGAGGLPTNRVLPVPCRMGIRRGNHGAFCFQSVLTEGGCSPQEAASATYIVAYRLSAPAVQQLASSQPGVRQPPFGSMPWHMGPLHECAGTSRSAGDAWHPAGTLIGGAGCVVARQTRFRLLSSETCTLHDVGPGVPLHRASILRRGLSAAGLIGPECSTVPGAAHRFIAQTPVVQATERLPASPSVAVDAVPTRRLIDRHEAGLSLPPRDGSFCKHYLQ
jgi:hypothetical protein